MKCRTLFCIIYNRQQKHAMPIKHVLFATMVKKFKKEVCGTEKKRRLKLIKKQDKYLSFGVHLILSYA